MELDGNDSLTFALSESDGLTFNIGDGGVMAFDIDVGGVVAFDVSTPHVIDADVYDDEYEVAPKTYSQTLETKSKFMTDDITIKEIPYFETSNEDDGITVYIANTIA